MKIYLAGPMRGYPEHNFPEFHRVAALLRDTGHEVFNPAENDADRASRGLTTTIRDVLGDDLKWICAHADAVAVLDGWIHSMGARAEVATAKALDLPYANYREFMAEESDL